MTRWYARYVVFMLILALGVAFLDRQIFALLVDPIKTDIGISEVQVGLVMGPAYAVFFTLMIIPMGWAIDRVNRTYLLTAGIFLWALMTALCGFVGGFGTMFAARMGVGIGEAAASPLSQSVIGDTMEDREMPAAMGFLHLSQVWGPGLALIFGGAAITLASYTDALALPFSNLAPWRQVFIIVAIPGFILAPLCFFTVRVPQRKRSDALALERHEGLKAFWRQNKNFIWRYELSVGCFTAGAVTLTSWMPSVFIRVFHWQAHNVGPAIGTVMLVFGTIASIAWGAVSSAQMKRGKKLAALDNLVILGILQMFIAPLAPLMPNGQWALAALAPCFLVSMGWGAMASALVQLIAPAILRGRIAALYLAFGSLTGMILANVGVAAITQYLLKDPMKINISVAIATALFWGMGALGFRSCRRGYEAGLKLQPDRDTSIDEFAGQVASA
jgi:MFS family permease